MRHGCPIGDVDILAMKNTPGGNRRRLCVCGMPDGQLPAGRCWIILWDWSQVEQ